MDKRLLHLLALVALAVAVLTLATRASLASTTDVSPQAYLPLVAKAASSAAEAAWSLVGNAGTNPAVNFIGTTDGKPLAIQPGAGNVGIGTTSPTARLEVKGPNDPVIVANHTGTSGNPAIWLKQDGADKAFMWWDKTANRLNLGTPNIFSILSLGNDGNVGVGTTSPGARLEAKGPNDPLIVANHTGTSGNPAIWLKQDDVIGGSIWFNRSDGHLNIATATANPVLAMNGSNVAIGTAPWGGARLDVEGPTSYAIYGTSTAVQGTGIKGTAMNGSSAYGVWGESSSGYAGFFSGKVRVTGTLEKAGGSFKIDDPIDPANKYLSHSFVESPDMKNIYDGVVALDATGVAEVTMPAWFTALNQDFRYQLTAIGAPGPNLYIAEEIHENQFKIAGGTAGMKVSWQVTGIRHDAWANANRIPVEEDKPGVEKGSYLHPELFGQPASKSFERVTHPDTMRQLQATDSQP